MQLRKGDAPSILCFTQVSNWIQISNMKWYGVIKFDIDTTLQM